jgi:hypothetical protein
VITIIASWSSYHRGVRNVLVAVVAGAVMGWLLVVDRAEKRTMLIVLAAVSLIGTVAFIWQMISSGSTSVAVSLALGGGAALLAGALRR